MRVVEFRIYSLHPETGPEYERLFYEQAAPMLARWSIDVVDFGVSLADPNRYYLIRAYDDLGQRQQIEEAFYSSAEWRDGPRNAVLSLIDSFTDVVLELDIPAIDSLRRGSGDAVDAPGRFGQRPLSDG